MGDRVKVFLRFVGGILEVSYLEFLFINCIQCLKFWKYRPIFRVSVNIDKIYPSYNRSTEISEFFGNYRRYFADISVFYRFFGIFPDILALFMNSHISGYC